MMMSNKHSQQGFSLFMVMIMMIVIALLVVITSQTTSTESRLSANEADRKFALSQAEIGLRDAENYLNVIYDDIKPDPLSGAAAKTANLQFTADCQKGLCAPVEKVVWARDEDKQNFNIATNVNGTQTVAAWERNQVFASDRTSIRAANSSKARYIIEYMGQRQNGTSVNDYFRVTARSQGENQNTIVTLQSYVEMTRNF